ncbi:MAG TPA: hypothetical protein VGG20_07070, partial [Thermoanaerobaculia bacterium]
MKIIKEIINLARVLLLRKLKEEIDRVNMSDSALNVTMTISRWEVWHVYSCYLSHNIQSLEDAVRGLLSSGFGESAAFSDGAFAWSENGKINIFGPQEEDDPVSGRTALHALAQLRVSLRYPALIFGCMRSAERKIFGESSGIPARHARFFLPLMKVKLVDGIEMEVEVIVQIFESGVVLLSFRSGGNDRSIGLADFIDNHVNLGLKPIEEVEGDLDFSLLAMDAVTAEKDAWWKRWKTASTRSQVRKRLLQRSVEPNRAKEDPREAAKRRIVLKGRSNGSLSGIALETARVLAYCL